jgi:complex iron-sulfur molybdoenzyme family reductase subunit gamma
MSRFRRVAPPLWGLIAIVWGLLLPAALGAQESDRFISVKWAAGEPPLDPNSSAWLKLPAAAIVLYPQASVAPATSEKPLAAKLRALHTAKTLALHLEWPDAAAARELGIARFPDAVALQWPVAYGPGRELPYVGMGHAGAPVALWFWRAGESAETLAAEGFGTLTRQPADGVQARGAWKAGTWRVVFRRALAAGDEHHVRIDPPRQGLVPVALAVWNGEAAERNGLKRLSAWQWLRFEKGKVDAAAAKQASEAPVAGDPGRGKRLMSEKGCAGCHVFPGNPAQPQIGPDLTYAGGIHSVSYLADSLAEPSKIIVPGKGYFAVQDGKKLSLMPPFPGTEDERRDIVAFLRRLR